MKLFGLIPAAGRGERMIPLTNRIPKPLIEIKGKPLIQNAIEFLAGMGIKDIVVALHYKKNEIREFLDSRDFNVNIEYSYPRKLLGLAYSILSAKDLIDNTFVTYLPDNIFTENCTYALDAHQEERAFSTLVMEKGHPEGRYEALKLEGTRILDIVEKAEISYGYRGTGIYIFEPGIFANCESLERSNRKEQELQDAIQKAIQEDRKVIGVPIKGKRFDVTEPSDIPLVERKVKELGLW